MPKYEINKVALQFNFDIVECDTTKWNENGDSRF